MHISIAVDNSHLAALILALRTINNWMNLGLFLGIEHSTLQKIDREERGRVEDCKREMLSEWLRSSDIPCTKEHLTRAVMSMRSHPTTEPHM